MNTTYDIKVTYLTSYNETWTLAKDFSFVANDTLLLIERNNDRAVYLPVSQILKVEVTAVDEEVKEDA